MFLLNSSFIILWADELGRTSWILTKAERSVTTILLPEETKSHGRSRSEPARQGVLLRKT